MDIAVSNRSLLRSPVFLVLAGMLIAWAFFGMNPAHAADATGGGGPGLPWESPVQMLTRSVSGPIAFGVSLLGIIGCGATLIWGGEITEFARRMVYVVIVVCILVFANTLLTGKMFSGAMVPAGVLRVAAHDALAPIHAASR